MNLAVVLTLLVSMMANKDLNPRLMNWNRLILLHGPPGTGKSTLW
jgi:SpoVK/Ycf46/Vps4 family AAA+-type ATPase